MNDTGFPLFPLGTVLYPGGPLPLRIFEPRYVDMVSSCLKSDSEFGVVAIRSGSETGAAETFPIGTTARITNWYRGDDGLLEIATVGRTRFRVESVERARNGLYVGSVERLAPERPRPLAARHRPLAAFLTELIAQLPARYRGIDTAYGDASWVGYRLAEILPLPVTLQQSLLELEDADARLDRLGPVVRSLDDAPDD